MAGWGDDWGFDWGNAILDAAITPARIQITASPRVPTVVSPSATIVTPATLAISANVRVPNVLASSIIVFVPGHPFQIYRSVTAGSAVARNVTTPVGV